MTLIDRYRTVQSTLLPDVKLLCVSKTKPATDIRTLYQVGQRDFGENYLQECLQKQKQLADLDICWHYIGSIQRNKTRDIAQNFTWVHTVSRAIIAERLNSQRQGLSPLQVLIQVNIDDEASKSGCLVEEVEGLAVYIESLENLCLRGLMIIPSKTSTDAFVRTRELFVQIQKKHAFLHWDTLSMGMSGDIAEAMAQGSTMVRVGSAIFGAR